MAKKKRLTKYYFEYYAILSLMECYDCGFSEFLEGGNTESPDFQSDKLNLGIEVTEAIRTLKTGERYIVSYDTEITLDELYDCIKRIKSRIYVKTIKLNKLYRKFERNWLYIFTHNVLIKKEDIKRLIKNTYYDSKKDYDKIFIDCIDKIYVIDKYRSVRIISVPFESQKRIKEKLSVIIG